LQNLKNCKLNPELSFWLQLFLLTTNENPSNTVYIHSDKLEYHANDASQSDYGSVRVPITPDDIQAGIKQYKFLKILILTLIFLI